MATNDTTAISLAELKQVAKALQSQRDTMNSLYKNNIVSILDSSKSCFRVAGVDYSEIERTFSSTYTELDKKYQDLINVLNNNVIAGYTEVSNAIIQLFNKDFASKFYQILGSTKR